MTTIYARADDVLVHMPTLHPKRCVYSLSSVVNLNNCSKGVLSVAQEYVTEIVQRLTFEDCATAVLLDINICNVHVCLYSARH